jgi:multidrug resistance efflux pump
MAKSNGGDNDPQVLQLRVDAAKAEEAEARAKLVGAAANRDFQASAFAAALHLQRENAIAPMQFDKCQCLFAQAQAGVDGANGEVALAVAKRQEAERLLALAKAAPPVADGDKDLQVLRCRVDQGKAGEDIAAAKVRAADADRVRSEADLARIQPLYDHKILAQGDYDACTCLVAQAQAAVAAAKAELAAATAKRMEAERLLRLAGG